MLLSKSQYIRGLQCHKSLWLYKHKRDLQNESNQETESLFSIGDTVGDYATQLFPGGVEIEFTPNDFDGMIKKTSKLIEEGVETIYEAAFKEKDIFAMADILHKTDQGWNIYEVKASTATKEYHRNDAAIQHYALNNTLKINKVFIIHINNQYERDGELDINTLFTIDDITDDVIARQADIYHTLKSFDTMLQKEQPQIDIGAQCSTPHDCSFSEYCWKHIPKPSVFNLYRMNGSKKFDLYYKGIIEYKDVPDDLELNTIQRIQIDSFVKDEIIIDKEVISNFLETIEYPISFFDFETFQNAIPRFDSQRPYMQMPFQYSLHVMNDQNELSHIEYLGDENTDPRRELSERMLNDIPKTGSIMAYYMPFEKSRIKELAKLFPDLHDDLMSLTERFVDLLVPFQKLGYYHPNFNGSFSIKSVLPALFPNEPELDYKKLSIQNGGMAMDTFANLHLLKDKSQREGIRKDLLAYCHLDTLAMVRIWEKLKNITDLN